MRQRRSNEGEQTKQRSAIHCGRRTHSSFTKPTEVHHRITKNEKKKMKKQRIKSLLICIIFMPTFFRCHPFRRAQPLLTIRSTNWSQRVCRPLVRIERERECVCVYFVLIIFKDSRFYAVLLWLCFFVKESHTHTHSHAQTMKLTLRRMEKIK